MSSSDQINTDHLPMSVKAMISIIGVSATMALVEHFPGQTLILSKGKRPDGQASFSKVSKIIGEDNAIKFAEERDGTPIYIPKCDGAMLALREVRNAHIRADYDNLTRALSGRATVAILAINYDLSDRQIYNILNKNEAIPTNMELAF